LGTAKILYPIYNGSKFFVDYNLQKQYPANKIKVKSFIQSFSMESVDKQFMGMQLTDMVISTNLAKVTF
jgi:hypothetical protein